MTDRNISIDGVRNARTIGYLKNMKGEVLKPVFYRSGGLHDLTPKGLETLEKTNILHVVDLRSTEESTNHPDNLGKLNGYHIPILDSIHSGDYGTLDQVSALEELYYVILEHYKGQYKKVFDVLGSIEDGAVLYHCTVGKDRTGLLSMLLLTIAGVSRDDIVRDYTMTGNTIATGPNAKGLDNVPQFLFESPKEALINTIDWLDKNYGGAFGYLKEIGVSADQQDYIKRYMGLSL